MKREIYQEDEAVRSAAGHMPGLGELGTDLLDCLGAGLFVCDCLEDGFVIAEVSRSFTGITGYSETHAVGRDLSFLFGLGTEAAVLSKLYESLSRGSPFHGELLCHFQDGKPIWCELVLAPFPRKRGSKSIHFAGALTDISLRKEREHQLQDQETKWKRVFENAVEGIYQSTPEGRYLAVNPALARMYGYESPEQLLNQVQDIQKEVYVDASFRERFKAEIEKSDQVRGLEYQVRRRDERVIWICENARVVRDSHGRVLYYEGFIEDITQRKESELALLASQRQLMEGSRQIGMAEVATSILHNLGNALNSVNVSLNLASDKLKTSRLHNLGKAASLLHDNSHDLAAFFATDPRGKKLPVYLSELCAHLLQERADLLQELQALRKALDTVNGIVALQQTYVQR